eukprot:Nk52_evm26s1444 gene=Nk52_evmTU26s1444
MSADFDPDILSQFISLSEAEAAFPSTSGESVTNSRNVSSVFSRRDSTDLGKNEEIYSFLDSLYGSSWPEGGDMKGKRSMSKPSTSVNTKKGPKSDTKSKSVSGSNSTSGDADSGNDDTRASKRARNREAAARCREKRRRLIDQLETEGQVLRKENKSLHSLVDKLQHEIRVLRGIVVQGIQKEQTTAFNKLEAPAPKQRSSNTHIPPDMLAEMGLNL